MKSFFLHDYYQYSGKRGGYWIDLIRKAELRYLYFQRKADVTNGLASKLYSRLSFLIGRRRGLEIYTKNIGKYFYIGHPYGITINRNAVLGDCVSVHKGCTVGQENRGVRKGTPIVGNCVWIGINAAIVGNIKIGDDVLIAPNSYVNCNVPPHSIVIGNPCMILPSDHATKDYFRFVNAENYTQYCNN